MRATTFDSISATYVERFSPAIRRAHCARRRQEKKIVVSDPEKEKIGAATLPFGEKSRNTRCKVIRFREATASVRRPICV
jgi:hypothetical protein